jgi:hypothetical protein
VFYLYLMLYACVIAEFWNLACMSHVQLCVRISISLLLICLEIQVPLLYVDKSYMI